MQPEFQMDSAKLGQFVNDKWDSEIVPQLVDYIRIPNKSPMFDANWVQNGYMEQAVTLMENWAKAQQLPGLKVEVVRLEGRTPLIFLEIPATGWRVGNRSVNDRRATRSVVIRGQLSKLEERLVEFRNQIFFILCFSLPSAVANNGLYLVIG